MAERSEAPFRPYHFFPGCSLEGTGRDYAESVRAVAGALGLRLLSLPGWECCGASVAKSVDDRIADLLPAANLARAAAVSAETDLVAACPACYQNHLRIGTKTAADEGFRASLNEGLSPQALRLDGSPRVRHLLEVLNSDIPAQDILARIRRPLRGIRALPYYGCLLVRPHRLGGVESREDPRALERLLALCGATPLPFAAKTDCCGGGLLVTRESVAVRLTAKILAEVVTAKPDCIVVACPLCHFMLDAKQRAAEGILGRQVGVPVLYFTQLLGLALGLPPRSIGLRRSLFPAHGLLQRVGCGESAPITSPPRAESRSGTGR